jgi:NADH-quinone oxidoreductase subunit N
MYFKQGDGQSAEMSSGFKAMLVGVAAITILLGLFPNLLTYWLYF